MSNVDRITAFAELNRHTAHFFSESLKSANFEEIDQGICSMNEFKMAFNECVDNIKEYAGSPKSTFVVKLIEYFTNQRCFFSINGVDELFSRRDFDTAEYLIYFNEINSTILNAVWRYDYELFDDLLPHCVVVKADDVQIKTDALRYYFTSSFLGIGTGSINHFDDSLIPALCQKHSAKEIAGIALSIYNNEKVISKNRKPTTFSAWYEVFCDCLGTTKKTYQPKDLTVIQVKIKNALPFLS